MSDWLRVSRVEPCPICQKPDWCTIATDGTAACCMRVESDRRMANGGWLHRLGKDLLGTPVRAHPAPPKFRLSPEQAGRRWARWASQTDDQQVDQLATQLGVTSASLRAIGACWAWPHEAWAFPMFDGGEEFAGIRLRSDTGDKWALRGSRQGIFIPSMELQGDVLVVEGPTDAAAAVSLGFYAIGRPSCTGGTREIAALCQAKGIQRLTVVSDNDGPGIAGARAFCAGVGLPTRLAVLPAKDLREWVRNGATRAAVEACLTAHNWKGHK